MVGGETGIANAAIILWIEDAISYRSEGIGLRWDVQTERGSGKSNRKVAHPLKSILKTRFPRWASGRASTRFYSDASLAGHRQWDGGRILAGDGRWSPPPAFASAGFGGIYSGGTPRAR